MKKCNKGMLQKRNGIGKNQRTLIALLEKNSQKGGHPTSGILWVSGTWNEGNAKEMCEGEITWQKNPSHSEVVGQRGKDCTHGKPGGVGRASTGGDKTKKRAGMKIKGLDW